MAANEGGFAALDEMIRRLRGLPSAFREKAPELAELVKKETDQAISEGHSLDGKPWPLTKEGKQPLQNAAKAVKVYVSGDFIIAELTGVEVFHHYGAGRVPARPILPTSDGMPQKLGQAIRAGSVKVWNGHMRQIGGAGG